MTTTLTPRQITSHIKKELLKKYPGITKISVRKEIRNYYRVRYEGGCNESDMVVFLDTYFLERYDLDKNKFIINIDGVDHEAVINAIFTHRTFNKAQAQAILYIVKEFAEANNQVIDLELSNNLRHGWLLLTPNLSHTKALIESPRLGYIKTPGLVDILNSCSQLTNPDGEITEYSLFIAIHSTINF